MDHRCSECTPMGHVGNDNAVRPVRRGADLCDFSAHLSGSSRDRMVNGTRYHRPFRGCRAHSGPVYGRSAGLSPVAFIASATFWTWLWGPIGLILATPLTICLVVLGRHVEQLKFLEVMFGDEPPLKPTELLYQRMLGVEADLAHPIQSGRSQHG
jgi:hypothetical protein